MAGARSPLTAQKWITDPAGASQHSGFHETIRRQTLDPARSGCIREAQEGARLLRLVRFGGHGTAWLVRLVFPPRDRRTAVSRVAALETCIPWVLPVTCQTLAVLPTPASRKISAPFRLGFADLAVISERWVHCRVSNRRMLNLQSGTVGLNS